jgi:putative oxidoreductase
VTDGPGAGTSVRRALLLLRIAVASIFVVHGVTRVALGIVDDFGGFLEISGLPAGLAVAWIITVIEIVGGLALALGRAVRPLVGWFALQIIAGIVLVHGREGWFVVGAGRNGVEYSVLILVCLLVTALAHGHDARSRRA